MRRGAIAGLLAATAVVGGCGEERAPEEPPASPATAADFPKPKGGQSIADLRAELGSEGLVLAPSVSVLESGQRSRFGFGLFDATHAQVSDAQVGLYLAREGSDSVSGPFPARYESLAVEPEFQSEGAALDPDSAGSVYAADLPLGSPGRYQVLAAVALGDRLVPATPAAPLDVVHESKVPEVGEPAPRISTPTVTSVGGAIEEIDTRVPPAPDLHETDFADVVGEKPAILLFATPALCQSQVCGPVVDVMLQAKAAHENEEIEFIHMEVFEDNEVEAGYRPQLEAFHLRTEPWLFAIDRHGEVVARIEGAFGASELERAIDAATSG
jgi:hypothetical protein